MVNNKEINFLFPMSFKVNMINKKHREKTAACSLYEYMKEKNNAENCIFVIDSERILACHMEKIQRDAGNR
jgi:hypothetical protein